VRRVGWWRFPVHELTQDGKTLARLGRSGYLRIYFRSGQKVELPNGNRWRVRSFGAAGSIYPIVVDSSQRMVATAGIGHGTYGINTKGRTYVLFPTDPRILHREKWLLRHEDEEVAVITRNPFTIEAMQPVHLGAALLGFVLARYGIPGEGAPRFRAFRWG
jgi:hypothetical protein